MFAFLFCGAKSEQNGIFKQVFHENIVQVDVSGSSKHIINGTLQMSKPEYAIIPTDKNYDWCSNCYASIDDHPWISFSLKQKLFKINGYYIKCGCCYEGCCCQESGNGYVDCCMYSWVFEISNDYKSWTEIHKVEKDKEMKFCKEKTYMFDKEYTTKYIRITQTRHCPGNPSCMSINKLEFFGETINESIPIIENKIVLEEEEDVSIIGHLSKDNVILE